MIIVVKLKLFILTQFGGNRMLGVFWLTTDCNMKCIYCYEGNEKKKMYMNEETIDKAIEFLMTRAKELKDKRMNIEFHGGEPLLAYKSMESIVYKLRAKCDMEEIELRFGCTTNATLLNENSLITAKFTGMICQCISKYDIQKEKYTDILQIMQKENREQKSKIYTSSQEWYMDNNDELLQAIYELLKSVLQLHKPTNNICDIELLTSRGSLRFEYVYDILSYLESRLNIKINYMTVSRYDMLTVGTLTKFFKESGREYFEKV